MTNMLTSFPRHLATFVILSLLIRPGAGDESGPSEKAIVGRWDLTMRGEEREYPSWLEIRLSGYRTLVGSFVGQFGSARPIGKLELSGQRDDGPVRFQFSVPPQWEKRMDDLNFEGAFDGTTLRGTTKDEAGQMVAWTGRRAPTLNHEGNPQWEKPIQLFNGRDLTGWKPRGSADKHGWTVRDGILVNATPGTDLVTQQAFDDFQLRVEFRYPKKSNSGIYLRGRYEVQIEDNYGDEPDSHKIGGVYGFLTPSINAAKPAGEWQTMEIVLVGRVLTVHLNEERIIDRQTIPGITGGAIDSDEGSPGPLLLQGDHGQVEFRKVVLTPARR